MPGDLDIEAVLDLGKLLDTSRAWAVAGRWMHGQLGKLQQRMRVRPCL